MKTVFKIAEAIVKISKWIALATMVFMMLFIIATIIGRIAHNPILGSNEIIQLVMVILIMFGLVYTQTENAHVSIGLVVDRLSRRAQFYLDNVAYVLTFIVSMIVSWVFFNVGMKNMLVTVVSTDLVRIPHYPFNFIICLGFFLWGLEALLKIIKLWQQPITDKITETKDEVNEQWL